MLTLALEDAQPDRNEQGACLQHRQYPQPEALVMSLGILLVPNVPRKPGAQVQQGHLRPARGCVAASRSRPTLRNKASSVEPSTVSTAV